MYANFQITYDETELDEAKKLLDYLQGTEGCKARVEMKQAVDEMNALLPDGTAVTKKSAPDPDEKVVYKTEKTAAPEPVKAEAAPTPAPTLEDVRKECQAFIAHKGSETFKAILEQLGAKRLSDVKPEQFQELIGAIHAN